MCMSAEEKQSLVARYMTGEPAAEIYADAGVARSIFYSWIKPFAVTIAIIKNINNTLRKKTSEAHWSEKQG